MQALLDASEQRDSSFAVAAVISNRAEAKGLDVARARGVHTVTLPPTDAASADDDRQLARIVAGFSPAAIALAGYMRILSAEFVQTFSGRMLNVHPSLLPDFPGLHTHRRALQGGAALHGATVHFVTEALDAGPAVLQARLRVREADDEASLGARVLALEHRIFPAAVQWYCEGRLQYRDGDAWFEGRRLDAPVQWHDSTAA